MTELKKPYKPKPEKVAKLTAYMDKLPVVKCELFKRTAKAIAIVLLMTSCSAEWHVKRAVKKDPTIIHPTIVTIDTIVVREERTISDTFVTTEHDTITMEDSFVYTQVIREKDIIKVYTKCKGDTIRITKSVAVPKVVMKRDWIELATFWIFIVLLMYALYVKITR